MTTFSNNFGPCAINLSAPDAKPDRFAASAQPQELEPRKFIDHPDWSVSYVVKERDTLAGIASDAYKHAFGREPHLYQLQETMTSIMIANNLRLLRVLPGQKLFWDKTFSYC